VNCSFRFLVAYLIYLNICMPRTARLRTYELHCFDKPILFTRLFKLFPLLPNMPIVVQGRLPTANFRSWSCRPWLHYARTPRRWWMQTSCTTSYATTRPRWRVQINSFFRDWLLLAANTHCIMYSAFLPVTGPRDFDPPVSPCNIDHLLGSIYLQCAHHSIFVRSQ